MARNVWGLVLLIGAGALARPALAADCAAIAKMQLADTEITRAAPVQPSAPNKRNVIATDLYADKFNGSIARTAMRRNNQGNDAIRSIADSNNCSVFPPSMPAATPMNAAIMVAKSAAAGASNSEIRVPCKSRDKRSLPNSSVPKGNCLDGRAFGCSRNCLAYGAGAIQSALNAASITR